MTLALFCALGRSTEELVDHRHYATRDEAKQDIFEYIEVFYNRQRRHSTLGYRSPAEYEKDGCRVIRYPPNQGKITE